MVDTLDLNQKIRVIPDFPEKGVLFRDITTLLKDAAAFRQVMDIFANHYRDKMVEAVVAVESRGFIFGGALADRLSLPLVPVRKFGKLPAATVRVDYELEYGKETLEMHRDALLPRQRVVIMDDLLATGGTGLATAQLVEQLGAIVVELAFLIELAYLGGREKLKDYHVFTVLTYNE